MQRAGPTRHARRRHGAAPMRAPGRRALLRATVVRARLPLRGSGRSVAGMIARRLLIGAVDAGVSAGTGTVSLGVGAGRRALNAGSDLAGEAFLQAARQVLAWRYTAKVLDLALRSSAAEQAVDSLLDGPL